ncbi:hypothetical protein ABK040_013766 [Willaertia magna]
MAERKATNKYIPPDFDPKKHNSINSFRNSHPLRQRASKLKSEGILVIRFELPYNAICTSCNCNIGAGTRFNAEKQQDGNYLSSPIYKFSMKCPNCKELMIIHTDPKNHEYNCTSGIKWRTRTFQYEETDNAPYFDVPSDNEKEKNAMDKIEHEVEDIQKAEILLPNIEKLYQIQKHHFHDDYSSSRKLRDIHRKIRKKEKQEVERVKNTLGEGFVSENGVLLKEKPEDSLIAKEAFSSRVLHKERTSTMKSIFSEGKRGVDLNNPKLMMKMGQKLKQLKKDVNNSNEVNLVGGTELSDINSEKEKKKRKRCASSSSSLSNLCDYE